MTTLAVQNSAPQNLFKYVSRKVGELVLTNRSLRWSTPGTLNDPYDMQFDLQVDIDKEALKAAGLRKVWEAWYGDQSVPAANRLGLAIRTLRETFPQLTA